MKRYKDYMDGVEVSDTLHRRLVELETPKKRPAAWKKYGAVAAALVLVAGVGAYGLSRGGWGVILDSPNPNLQDTNTARAEREDIPAPDIAFEDPDGNFTAPPSGGGYEVVHGDRDDPNTMVSYFVLPYLNWADVSQGSAMDYSLAPPSAIHRDAALDDVLAFAGGEKAMVDHLLWDGLDWGGMVWFLEDGTPCAVFLHGGGNSLSFSLEVMKGGKVPSCIVLPAEYYEASQWQGVEITAVKNGGYAVIDGVELGEKREVSFFFDGVGYKLTLYADAAARADELCARFVRYAVDGGFHLDALSNHGAVGYSDYSVGEPNYGDGVSEEGSDVEDFYCDCPDCIAGVDHTHPYDPSTSDVDFVVTAPPYNAPN